MNIRVRETGEVLSGSAFRALFPNKSLPIPMQAEVLSELGADEVLYVGPPSTLPTQTVTEIGVEFVNGKWQTKWAVNDLPTSEAESRLFYARQMTWELVKKERDNRRFNGGVKVGDNWFLSTSTATSEYNTLILMSQGLPSDTVLRANWRTMNGGVVDMTPALAKTILISGFAHIAAIDDAAQIHKANIEASNDPSNYDFSNGWPEIFGG